MENIHIKNQCLEVHPNQTLRTLSKVSHRKMFIFLALLLPVLKNLIIFLATCCQYESGNYELIFT